MYELLYKKINSIVDVSKGEFEFCKTLFVSKRLRKRQYFLQEGDVCKYQAFVVKGLLRSYTVDEKGNEHVLQFSSEAWWVADLSSYLTAEPSFLNIEALEDVELLLLSKPLWEEAMKKIPAFEHYF